MSDDYDDDVLDDDSEVTTQSGSSASNVALDVDISDLAERQRAREQLEADVAAFLANGGEIQEVAVNVMADPPRAPQSNYGGQPI